jgi:hypothetical protein
VAFGDLLEKFQPMMGGKSDSGDMQANRAGIELGPRAAPAAGQAHPEPRITGLVQTTEAE